MNLLICFVSKLFEFNFTHINTDHPVENCIKTVQINQWFNTIIDKMVAKIITLLLLSVASIRGDTCTMSVAERRDCGDIHTTSQSCLNKGCCWQVATEPTRPNCFYKKSDRHTNPALSIHLTFSLSVKNNSNVDKFVIKNRKVLKQ